MNKSPERSYKADSNAQSDKTTVGRNEPVLEPLQTGSAEQETALEKRQQGKLLSSGEAASMLGISRSELRRREALGMYQASYIADNGWHYFDPEYVSSLPGYGSKPRGIRGRQTAAVKAVVSAEAFPKKTSTATSAYNPQDASRIFQALDDGMSSRDIVKTLLVHPDTMKVVYEAWKQLGTLEGGGIQISAKTLEAINELPLPGTYPINTQEQLLENLRQASKDTPTCNSCHKLPCRICLACAETIYTTPEPVTKLGRPRKTA